jgi:hypothetical protein
MAITEANRRRDRTPLVEYDGFDRVPIREPREYPIS